MIHTGSSGSSSSSSYNFIAGTLHIPGYHFNTGATQSLNQCEDVSIVYGYRISNRARVVAKVAQHSLSIEREYHTMRRLYQFKDGPLHLVRPLEYLNLPSGLAVAIYVAEGEYTMNLLRHGSDSFSVDTCRTAGEDLPSWSDTQSESSAYRKFPESEQGSTQARTNNGGLCTAGDDLGAFLRFAIKCLDCLEFVHKCGVTHGEISLTAFQWTGDDSAGVKLWNFGSSGNRSFEKYLTSEGWRKSSQHKVMAHMIQYVSPEQTGRTTYAPDHRSDIYSLGICFFVLLTGRHPFDGGPLDALNGITSRKIALVHEIQLDVPEILSRIVEKMTSRAPDDRYSSVHGVRHDILMCFQRLTITEQTCTKSIPMFPLAEKDIASVFTLPKTPYGRETVISELTCIFQRYVGQFRPCWLHDRTRSTSAASYSACTETFNPVPNSFEVTFDSISEESEDDKLAVHSDDPITAGSCRSIEDPVCDELNNNNVAIPTTTLVAVYGPGGIGKSTTLASVSAMARQQGYIVTEKFDSKNKVPYSCVLRSLSQILQQILSENEDDIKTFCNHLKKGLGTQFSNINILAGLVPELKLVLDPNQGQSKILSEKTPVEQIQLDNIEARSRFHTLFIEVFRAAANWRIITLFLDDLHLADDPSLELLKSLAMSRVKVLIFMSYRDQEITPRLVELLELKMTTTYFIKLDPLGMDPLIDYLCDTLHRSRDVCREFITPLAQTIYDKTQGNPFYITQLLRALERKSLLFFNWKISQWDYHLEEIRTYHGLQSDTEYLDIPFLVARLRELPKEAQKMLALAAFVGDTFAWSTVKTLMAARTYYKSSNNKGNDDDESSNPSTHDPISSLHTVLQEGYIMPVDADEFKWSHDRISQAAMELTTHPETRKTIHMEIAQYLMNEEVVDSFLVADHLLKCLDLVLKLDEKRPYRNVLIEAGNKGQFAGAHQMAFDYYMGAIRLSDPDVAWTESDQSYKTTLNLHTNAVALSWVVGEYEATEYLLEVVFKNARTATDRIPAHRVNAKYCFSRQMHDKGREALHKCLGELGYGDIDIRSEITEEDLAEDFAGLIKSLESIGGVEKLLDLKMAEDPVMQNTIIILEQILTLAYWSGNKFEMFSIASKILLMSIRIGVVPETSTACGFAAVGLGDWCGKFALAEALGATGVALADKHGFNEFKGQCRFIYAAFMMHFKYHQREALHWFKAGSEYCLASGDRIYASFCQAQIATTNFSIGKHLSCVIASAEASFQAIHSWSTSSDANIFAMCIIRVAKALQGRTYISTPDVFNGDDGFNDDHFVAESIRYSSNPEIPMNRYWSLKMIPLTLYGHIDTAIATGYRCFQAMKHTPLNKHTRMMLCYFSLALIEKARQRPEQYEACIAQVKVNQTLARLWAVECRINYMWFWTIVEAELTSLTGDPTLASGLYEDAIDHAREGEWLLEQCVSHEYYGAHCKRIGLHNSANNFIKKAVELYAALGAYGKSKKLEAKYHPLLKRHSDDGHVLVDCGVQTDPLPYLSPEQSSSWCSGSVAHTIAPEESACMSDDVIIPATTEQALMTLDIIDMASILKSSQVLASEVKFDSLLKSMMSIILENSGADRGAIIIKDKRHGVSASGDQQEGITTYDPPKVLDDHDPDVPSRIIRHTLHTRDIMYVHDISKDTRFAVGPWFERAKAKSVICMPITHKLAVIGCIFIEGPIGIFTKHHVTVLSLLCQQMGISIANAFLFQSVQKVTMANMRMIEMQKQALEETQKSKEAADKATRLRELFLANMSHEIRTPFSGFYGMISLLSETSLDPEQHDLVRTAKESCEILLQIIDDLLNFSKLQAGKVTLDLMLIVVEDLIADVVEMLIAMAIKKNINVTYLVSEDVPRVVIADANRLRQIIINLLGNAIKFTHQGEITIVCSNVSRKGQEEVTLQFEVIDTGIGITQEQRKVLFVPFSQVDGSTTRKYGGTGLGLSICLQLVELMSGQIDVDSQPGKGSKFYFTIQAKRPKEEPMMTLPLLPGMTVHVVDKYASTVDMVRRLLPSHVQVVDAPITSGDDRISILLVGLYHNYPDDYFQGKPAIMMHYPNLTRTVALPLTTRIAVPLRRSKLRHLLAGMIETPKTASAACKSSIEHKPASSAETGTSPEERDTYRTMSILAAEDNIVAQKLLYKQLTRLGFRVECADDGLEALETWSRYPPGHFVLAFFDHHMPKCDGVEATRRLRKLEAKEHLATRLPIVALTADIQDTAREICLQAGMDGYLTKPLNHKILLETIRHYCK